MSSRIAVASTAAAKSLSRRAMATGLSSLRRQNKSPTDTHRICSRFYHSRQMVRKLSNVVCISQLPSVLTCGLSLFRANNNTMDSINLKDTQVNVKWIHDTGFLILGRTRCLDSVGSDCWESWRVLPIQDHFEYKPETIWNNTTNHPSCTAQ